MPGKPTPMSAAEHLDALESLVYEALYGISPFPAWPYPNLPSSAAPAESTAMHGTWSRNDPGALTRDTDNDGISDALDGYFGPGAVGPFAQS